MSSRSIPWIAKPPDTLPTVLETVRTARLFLLQQFGPLSFLIATANSEHKFKVTLGSLVTCTCKVSPGRMPCAHIAFVMTKVFRVPEDNPLLWQKALLEREIEQLLRSRFNAQEFASRRRAAAESASEGGDSSNGGQPEQPRRLEVGDTCPICLEELAVDGDNIDELIDSQDLEHCRRGCGQCVHSACLAVWAKHKASSKEKISCPLCRAEWITVKASAHSKPRARSNAHLGSRCSACRQSPITGSRYRCIVCADCDLCEGCFNAGRHRQHSFVVKPLPDETWQTAERTSDQAARLQRIALELQNRELSDADYDQLLTLDAAPALHRHLCNSLPRAGASSALVSSRQGVQPAMCAVCDREVRNLADSRCAPCSHVFHQACIERHVAGGGDRCPSCGSAIFAGLIEAENRRARRQRRPREQQGSSDGRLRNQSGNSRARSAPTSSSNIGNMANLVPDLAMSGIGLASQGGSDANHRALQEAPSRGQELTASERLFQAGRARQRRALAGRLGMLPTSHSPPITGDSRSNDVLTVSGDGVVGEDGLVEDGAGDVSHRPAGRSRQSPSSAWARLPSVSNQRVRREVRPSLHSDTSVSGHGLSTASHSHEAVSAYTTEARRSSSRRTGSQLAAAVPRRNAHADERNENTFSPSFTPQIAGISSNVDEFTLSTPDLHVLQPFAEISNTGTHNRRRRQGHHRNLQSEVQDALVIDEMRSPTQERLERPNKAKKPPKRPAFGSSASTDRDRHPQMQAQAHPSASLPSQVIDESEADSLLSCAGIQRHAASATSLAAKQQGRVGRGRHGRVTKGRAGLAVEGSTTRFENAEPSFPLNTASLLE